MNELLLFLYEIHPCLRSNSITLLRIFDAIQTPAWISSEHYIAYQLNENNVLKSKILSKAVENKF